MTACYLKKTKNKSCERSQLFTLLFFKISYHVDTALMLSAFEFGVDKCISKLARKTNANYSCSEAENVCIVVSASEFCAENIGAASRSDTLELVCSHAHADSCAAAKDRKVSSSVKNLAAA